VGELKPTVLVVDDDALVRKALRDLFESVGLRVMVFQSTQEFLRAERPDVPCCLVLDVRLTGQSGLEFQHELNERNIALPIVFLTGHGDVPMSVRAMKAGAIEFLTKPYREQDLLDAVQAAIDRGCTDILALLTRPPDYVDPPPNLFLRELFRWRCAWGKPELVAAGREIHTRENRSRDLIFGRAALPANVNIAAICPTLDDGLGLLVKDEAVLRAAAQSAKRNVVEAFFDGNS